MLYVCSEGTLNEEWEMRRRILLVDDEVAVLLTLKAVLEISGFDVDTAASAREGVSKLHTREYHMLITDMRMESDACRCRSHQSSPLSRPTHPAVALLTAFPVADEDWQEMGADQAPRQTHAHPAFCSKQIEDLIASHETQTREAEWERRRRKDTFAGKDAWEVSPSAKVRRR